VALAAHARHRRQIRRPEHDEPTNLQPPIHASTPPSAEQAVPCLSETSEPPKAQARALPTANQKCQGRTAHATRQPRSCEAHRNTSGNSVSATRPPKQNAKSQTLRRRAVAAPPRGYPAAQALRSGFAWMMPLRGKTVFNNRYLSSRAATLKTLPTLF